MLGIKTFFRLGLRLLLVFLFFHPTAYAGAIGGLFSDGVFGLPWGSKLADVREAFPGGKEDSAHGITRYTVKDGRLLFKIPRQPGNELHFAFDAHGGMNGVSIEFPANGVESFGQLLNSLTTYFGPYENLPNSAGAVSVRWPTDQGVTLTLIQLPGIFSVGAPLVSIGYVNPQPEVPRKEALGF